MGSKEGEQIGSKIKSRIFNLDTLETLLDAATNVFLSNAPMIQVAGLNKEGYEKDSKDSNLEDDDIYNLSRETVDDFWAHRGPMYQRFMDTEGLSDYWDPEKIDPHNRFKEKNFTSNNNYRVMQTMQMLYFYYHTPEFRLLRHNKEWERYHEKIQSAIKENRAYIESLKRQKTSKGGVREDKKTSSKGGSGSPRKADLSPYDPDTRGGSGVPEDAPEKNTPAPRAPQKSSSAQPKEVAHETPSQDFNHNSNDLNYDGIVVNNKINNVAPPEKNLNTPTNFNSNPLKLAGSYFQNSRIPMLQTGSISSMNEDGSYNVKISGKGFSLTKVRTAIPSFSPNVGDTVTIAFLNNDRNTACILGDGYRGAV